MKTIRHQLLRNAAAFCGVLLFVSPKAQALDANEWRTFQTLDVPAPGLCRVALPVETLGAARPALEDLRLLDPAGAEVPFLTEQTYPAPMLMRLPKLFSVSLEKTTTVLLIETGAGRPIASLVLETPAQSFLKPARLEGSHDGTTWELLAERRPVFRQAGGAAGLSIEFPEGVWEFLRVTIDDERAEPVPFTGATLRGPREIIPGEMRAAPIRSRDDGPAVTRIAIDLGAANLWVSSVRLQVNDPLFTRAVGVAEPVILNEENAIAERAVATATIHRIALDGTRSEQLEIPVERQIRSRELLLLIRNDNSPPLDVASAQTRTRPVQLTFLAQSAGQHRLIAGNPRCAAPRYDLALLAADLKKAVAQTAALAPLQKNTAYRAPETLAGIEGTGAPLDVTAWKFSKSVTLSVAPAQQLELDLEVLANAQPGLADLRLMRDGRQVPFVIERTSITRAISPVVAQVAVPKRPGLSRWLLKLPQPRLPLVRFVCEIASPLFEREMRLWEEVAGSGDEKYPRELGHATWRRVPGGSVREFAIEFTQPPTTGTLFLETNNGDNPSIELRNFRVFHPVTRLVFKSHAENTAPLRLCYGNRITAPPRYDISLVAAQLLAAEKGAASLGPQERPERQPSPSPTPAAMEQAGAVFWIVLALVVVGLLVVVARLLPKAPQDSQ